MAALVGVYVAAAVAAALAAACAVLGSTGARRLRSRGAHVLVTGGSSGIGEAVAAEAIQRGASVTLLARDARKLEEARARLVKGGPSGAEVRVVAADVADEGALARAAASLPSAVDVLVCSAGLSEPGRFVDTPVETFERVMRVNWMGCVLAVRAFLPGMAAKGAGRVVLVSSQAGQVGVFGFTAYSSSKFALRGLAEALGMELKPMGVRVCLSFPPDTDTPLLAQENERKPAETKLISETSGLFSAEAVARDIVDGAERGDFLISTGLDGFMLKHLTAGMSAPDSPLALAAQVCLGGLFRLIAAGYAWSWDRTIAAEARKAKKSG